MALVNIEHKPTQWKLRNRVTYDFKTRIQPVNSIHIPNTSLFTDNTDISISFFIRVVSGSDEIFKKSTQILTVSELGLGIGLTYHVVINADLKVYINSIQQVLTKNIDWTVAADVIFGIFTGSDPASYDISNILFLNKSLTASEVYAIFSTAGAVAESLHQNVIAYYPINIEPARIRATEQFYIFDSVEQFNYAKVTTLNSNHAVLYISNFLVSLLATTTQAINFSGTGLGYAIDFSTGDVIGTEGNYTTALTPLDTTVRGRYAVGQEMYLEFSFDDLNGMTYFNISNDFLLQQQVLDLSQFNKITYISIYRTGGDLNEIIFPRTLLSDNFTTQIFLRGTLIETLDLSSLQTLGTNVYISNSSSEATRKLSSIKFPINKALITNFTIDGAPIKGVLDLSNLTFGASNIYLSSLMFNSLITEVILPVFGNGPSLFDLNGTSIKELDISKFGNLTGRIELSKNLLLEQLYLPVADTTSGATFDIDLRYSALNGTLDLSKAGTFGGSSYFDYSVGLTEIIFPTSAVALGYLSAQVMPLTGVLDLTGLKDEGLYNFNHTYITNILFSITGITGSTMSAQNTTLSGTLDLSSLTSLRQSVYLRYNSDLTNVILNTNSNATTYQTNIYLEYSNITGTLDLSDVTNLNNLATFYNPRLTNIIFGNDTQSMNLYTTFSCYLSDLTGTIDMSTLDDLPKNIHFYNNSNLTSLVFPTSVTNAVEIINFRSCNLQGTLDLSGINTLGDIGSAATITIDHNLELEYITFPVSGKDIKNFNLSNNNLKDLDISGFGTALNANSAVFACRWNPLSATILQQLLDDLDTIVPTGFISRSINIYNQILTTTEITNLKASASYINLKDVKNITMDLESF